MLAVDMAASNRPAPPLSLETAWDKGKWHFDAEDFPAQLPRSAGYAHIRAALRFLDERDQLTKEGKRELAGELGDDIALLREHVKTGARAFLDQSYDVFLGACVYGEPPAIDLLTGAWDAYVGRYDPAKRPRADAYQTILLAQGPTTDDVLRRAGRSPELRAQIRAALPFVPDAERALVETLLSAMDDDVVRAAREASDAETLLHALEYVRGKAADSLRATCILARRLGVDTNDAGRLPLVAKAVNIGWGPDEHRAWGGLDDDDRSLLARLVNALWESAGADRHLAMCAMRTVGDSRSVELIMARVPEPGEGTVQYGLDGPREPAWNEVRHQVRKFVAERAR